MQKIVLFLDAVHFVLKEKLQENGFEVVDASDWCREKVLAEIKNAFGIVVRSRLIIDKELIEAGAALQFIGRVGAGMENIDTIFAKEKNITCLNAPEGNRDSLGEHTLGMLLCLLHKIHLAHQSVQIGKWDRIAHRGTELNGKTVGIIGYGNMGSAFAQRLQGMDVSVIGYDKYKKNYSDKFITEKTLPYLLKHADIISLHIPLNNETEYFINTDFFNKLEKQPILINTSRGKIIKTTDLITALQNKTISGVVLDVLEYESHTFETYCQNNAHESVKYLQNTDNCILTPHVAGWSHQSNYKMANIMAKKIINLFA